MKHTFWLTAAVFGSMTMAKAEVQMSSIFSNDMILQRRQALPIWGNAAPGEAVAVKLGTAQAQTVADAQGQWKVELPPREAGTGLELTVTGQNSLQFRNVAVGEVWVCSGQSNMGRTLLQSLNAEAEIAAANYPNIRLLQVNGPATDEPQTDFEGNWQVCTPETVRRFSAVGYFFGRELHQKLNVPIGLISANSGGTPAETWTSRPALEAEPALQDLLDMWKKRVASYPADLAKYEIVTLPAWEKAAAAAREAGKPEPRKPSAPNALTSSHRPGSLFNGRIAPLTRYAIQGAIWYQGETNADLRVRAEEYHVLFPTLIRDWRKQWGGREFPFYWVQLANFRKPQEKPVEDTLWPILREAQHSTLALPNTGMATAIDLADLDRPTDIHPRNKQDVGKRLALVALAKTYGQNVEFSGPVLQKVQIVGSRMELEFDYAKGLQARGEKLQGFAIAGEDGVWHWADAKIENGRVVVSSPNVPQPRHVRYGWAMNPIGNLYNSAGLPALPFRTDTPRETLRPAGL